MAPVSDSAKKVAVLAGVSMVMAGGEISAVDALTVTDSEQFYLTTNKDTGTGSIGTTSSVSLDKFNTNLGNLDSVTFELKSLLDRVQLGDVATFTYSAAATYDDGEPGGPITIFSTTLTGTEGFNGNSTSSGPLSNKAFFESAGPSQFTVNLALNITQCLAPTTGDEPRGSCSLTWSGNYDEFAGISVTYEYTEIAPVPIPAALPLFATGLAGIGFVGWRRRRNKAKEKTSELA